MKGRMQKISNDNLQVKDRSETESELGVQTYMGITENNFTTIEQADCGLLEMILSPINLNKAYKQVKSNKGTITTPPPTPTNPLRIPAKIPIKTKDRTT